MNSNKKLARFAGVLYLIIFIVFPLSTMLGSSSIAMSGEAANIDNFLAAETRFRIGMAGEAVIFLIEVLLASLLYVLLKPVNPAISLAAAISRLAEGVVQGANLLLSALVLVLASGAGYLSAFNPEQLGALATLFRDAYDYGILIWGFFFGFHLLLLGYLVAKSGYFPRLVGILLALGGIGYLLESFGIFIVPQYSGLLSTIVLILAVPSELVFSVWLLWKGIDVGQYEEAQKRTLAVAS